VRYARGVPALVDPKPERLHNENGYDAEGLYRHMSKMLGGTSRVDPEWVGDEEQP